MFVRSLTTSFALLSLTALLACDTASTEKSSAQPKTQPSDNADNQGSGNDGQATEDAGDAGSTDYGAGGDNTIYVVNFATEDVCYLYLALDGSWSDDVLGMYALGVDEYYWVTGVPSGFIEMYAEGCNGSTWYGGDEVAGDYTFVLRGGSDGGGSDTGTFDTGY